MPACGVHTLALTLTKGGYQEPRYSGPGSKESHLGLQSELQAVLHTDQPVWVCCCLVVVARVNTDTDAYNEEHHCEKDDCEVDDDHCQGRHLSDACILEACLLSVQ